MTTNDTAGDTPPDASTDTAPTTDTTTDTVADVAKWKALAQKHEDRAKANAGAVKELETLRQQSMSDTDKAVAVARAEARTEALREAGAKLAESHMRLAAAGRNVDIDALIEGVNVAKFLDDAGDPDVKAITAWVDRVAPPATADTTGKRDTGTGVRGQSKPALNDDNVLMRDIKTALRM